MRVPSTFLRRTREIARSSGRLASAGANLAELERHPLRPMPDAGYAARIVLNLAEVTPHVSGPDTVQVMQSVAEIAQKKVAIQKAYLVSCVNSRLEDLEAAANVLRGKKIAPGVKFYLAAASRSVQEEAETSAASGRRCSTPERSRCRRAAGRASAWARDCSKPAKSASRPPIATSKAAWARATRKCYLASPEVVAASAIAGYICGPQRDVPSRPLEAATSPSSPATAAAAVRRWRFCRASRARCAGRLVFLPQDNLNTDGIYGKDYTYREDMTPEMMARVVMENYDPQFAARTRAGDVRGGRLQLRHRLQPRAGRNRAARPKAFRW